jgi:hypothetical protein
VRLRLDVQPRSVDAKLDRLAAVFQGARVGVCFRGGQADVAFESGVTPCRALAMASRTLPNEASLISGAAAESIGTVFA